VKRYLGCLLDGILMVF